MDVPLENGTMIPDIALTPVDKLAIMIGAALFLSLVFVCLVCVLSPYCWLYKYCPFQTGQAKRKKKDENERKMTAYGSTDLSSESEDKEKYPVYWTPLGTIKESEPSDWSDGGSSGKSSVERLYSAARLASSLSEDAAMTPDLQTTFLENAVIQFSLKYDKFDNKLTIHVQDVRGLAIKDLKYVMSPYIRIRLYRAPKQFFTFREQLRKEHVLNNLDMDLQSKMQRLDENVMFNEDFLVKIMPEDIKNYTLRFQLCDLDRMSRHLILGETTLSLRGTDLPDFTQIQFSQSLVLPTEEDMGEIELSLNYLPTAEKLSLYVSSLGPLKSLERSQQDPIECVVKVSLMLDGRQLKKSRTLIPMLKPNAEFQKKFTFDVPQLDVHKVYFIVSVSHSPKDRRVNCIVGRVYMGLNFDSIAREHWTEMIQNPRNQVSRWYKLQC